LLIETGVQDPYFPIDEAVPALERVRRIYEAAGAADQLHLDVHPGRHVFSGRKAFEFFERYL
jgi:hypothetical protein